VKALSVRSPWAGLIASGVKTLEVRSKRTHFRGELLICQSAGGGAVAIVEVVDCRPFCLDDVAATGNAPVEQCVGQFVWELRLLERVTSPTIKGSLSFFDVDPSVLTSREVVASPAPFRLI
jgi:hypothetical protein